MSGARERLHFTERQPTGLQFTEQMRGEFKTRPYEGVEISLTLTITANSLARLVNDPEHAASMVGTASSPLFPGEALVTDGVFNLMCVDPDVVERRLMLYRGLITATDGTEYQFSGFKELMNRARPSVWSDTTTLFLTLEDATGRHLGDAVLTLDPTDFYRQLRTMRVLNAERMVDRIDALTEFGGFFCGVLLDTYGRLFGRARLLTPDVPRRPPPRGIYKRFYPLKTEDGVVLRLVRFTRPEFAGADQRTVILSPGFGMSSRCFWLDAIDTSLAEYLANNRYDVWCLDYRASPALRSAGSAYTIDDVARYDYPAAIATVLKRTGAEHVQMVVHCVGSLAFLMAMLHPESGLRLEGKIRSVICSQLGVHPIPPSTTEAKTAFRVARLARWLGIETMSAEYDDNRWGHWLVDKVLRLQPTLERCNNPTCRRILFLYGESFLHDQLNTATHEAIREMFGTASLSALEHLSAMVRYGHAVDEDGEDVYLPEVKRLRVPITFLHGKRNREFLPKSTRTTYEWLVGANGADLYRWGQLRSYGHLDCFFGRSASRVVFPIILNQLRHPPPDPHGDFRPNQDLPPVAR